MRHDTAVRVGTGGMGEVFKAWDPDLERWVALKYLRHDDPELVQRLFREARAQARINHPGVCEVYEVGEEDGRPYIAMQFVDGRLLTDAAHGLPLERKVRLIKQVAEAVQAAHAEGLIHRDLKPGNIMVSETADGELQPYVLDFGIAREQEVPGVTVTGQVLGTPGYLSPEQARGEDGTLDRRSDIFSLGVILYELLSGCLPYDGSSEVEMLVALLHGEPIPLRRRMPRIPRDLETVVMTCLQDDPDQRYPSARELAEDLDRFLSGEPVHARQVSVAQKVLRRARRHPVIATLATAAAVAIMSLLAVVVGGWWKYTADLQRERNVAVEAQDRAEQREREAEEVAQFLAGVFEVSDPTRAKGEDLTARAILDAGAARVREELGNRPQIQARIMGIIGSIYSRLGLYDQAEPLLRDALEIVNSLEAPDDRAVIDSHVRLADAYIASGHYDKATELLEPVAMTAESTLGPDHLQVAHALDSLGRVQIRNGRYPEAQALMERALEIATAAVGPDHVETASIENDLAAALEKNGDFDGADAMYQRALATRRRELDADDPRIATTLSNYGNLLRAQGRHREAVPVLEQALAIREKVLEPGHPRISTTCNNLALAHKKLGDFDRAETLYLRSLEIREQTYGPAHPRTATVLANLANVYQAQGDFQRAEDTFRRAVEIHEETLPEHPYHATYLTGLADLLRERGRPAEAEVLLGKALDIQEAALGPDHIKTTRTLLSLALAYADQKRYEAAESTLDHVLELQREVLGPDHHGVARTLFELGRIAHLQGRAESAQSLMQEALSVEDASGIEDRTVQSAYAALLRDDGRDREASAIEAHATPDSPDS
jgi:tetratricopeptide (TPR) repeat protein/predicted Ser/Thr protein kinase